MTTKTTLRAQIENDIARSDLSAQINEAIDNAIDYYKSKRFFFNESRSSTFPTSAGTSIYTSDNSPFISLFIELDEVFMNDGNTNFPLTRETPEELEWLLDSNAARGRPYLYSYFEESFRFYSIPDATYTIRPIGLIEKAGPASADEQNNVWMTKAYELIRCRAKAYLATHVLMDQEMAIAMVAADSDAYQKLRRHTSKKQGSGRIVATQF